MNHNRQKNRIRDCWQDRLTLSIDAVLMVLFGLIIAYPLLYIILSSFEGGSSTLSLNIWPKKWSLAGYKAVFEYRWIWIGYANSIWYTLLGTTLGLVVTICCAYPLAQADLVGRNGIMALFVFTMYFGGGMIPTYLNMRNLHLLDTTLAMVLPGAVSVYNMIVMRTYFSTQIPAELHEAAQLYVKDIEASTRTPNWQLRGIRNVDLKPGETKQVTFELGARDFALITEDGKCVVEPGAFQIAVGGQQPDARSAELTGRSVDVFDLMLDGDVMEVAY